MNPPLARFHTIERLAAQSMVSGCESWGSRSTAEADKVSEVGRGGDLTSWIYLPNVIASADNSEDSRCSQDRRRTRSLIA